jgi:hypothetical protein
MEGRKHENKAKQSKRTEAFFVAPKPVKALLPMVALSHWHWHSGCGDRDRDVPTIMISLAE